jgi:hypothetical protein
VWSAQNKMLKALHASIKEGLYSPVRQLTFGAFEQKEIVVIFTPSEREYRLHGKLQKVDAKVLIRLLEYDRNVPELQDQQAIEREPDVRDIQVRFGGCLRSSRCRKQL